MRQSAGSLLPECDIDSDAIAGMLVATFEDELGDAGFVEVAEPFGDHAVVLALGCACERQIETEIAREFERDPLILGCVRGLDKAATLAVLHVFAVGFEYARGGC